MPMYECVVVQLTRKTDDERSGIISKFSTARRKATSGIYIISYLVKIIDISEVDGAVRIITCLAAFTEDGDPWTTTQAFEKATVILKSHESTITGRNGNIFQTLEYILKDTVKPLFSKTRNPAITAAGRKNLHPIPQPRFDPGLFDPETKPWKTRDIYVITLLSWIISKYSVRFNLLCLVILMRGESCRMLKN